MEAEERYTLKIPDFCVVVADRRERKRQINLRQGSSFRPSEVLSSDAFRAMVSDDENDQSATNDAFDALHHLAAIRLRRRKLVRHRRDQRSARSA